MGITRRRVGKQVEIGNSDGYNNGITYVNICTLYESSKFIVTF